MNLLFFNKCINLILLVILVNLRQNFSAPPTAPPPANDLVSLYNTSDKVTVVTYQNFTSIVYHSNTAWLIEFYASWCGHCRSYAQEYRKLGRATWAWKTIVRIGAINCYGIKNNALCRQHGVRGYPTLQLISPDAVFDNTSKGMKIPLSSAKIVENDLIKGLESLNKSNKTWPRFAPINRVTLEELYVRIPETNKHLIVIVERRDDLTGRQIMLDFSQYHDQIAIFRTTTDGRLWLKFHINLTDVPALFLILRNRTAERLDIKQNISDNIDKRNLFYNIIRSYINETISPDHFDGQDLKEIIPINNIETKQNLSQKNNIPDDVRDENTIHRKVNMIDLELVLSYMFRQEISQMQDIQGEAYNALVQWLTVLIKYFPGREPVMAYLKHLLLKINEKSKGLSGNQFLEIIDMKTSNAYLPDDHQGYQSCVGSAPQYRGYPCALWLLFHTLTVSQYKKEIDTINVIEIPTAIKNYVKYFFGCRQCSDNFMNETMDINQLHLQNKYEAVIYLWKIHNHVNKRLRDDITEDPKYPKVQFPSKHLCANCRSTETNEYDISNTINFLVKYYSQENIDTSLILKKSSLNKDSSNQPKDIISTMDYNNEIIKEPGFLIFLQRFSVYIFVNIIVLIILIRRRYYRKKKSEYSKERLI